MMEKILILTTWGTIDKIYSTWKGSYDFEIWEPAIERILEIARANNIKTEIVSFLKKDSLDLTEKDRLKIKKYLENRPEKGILITHWTDTMIETWKILKDLKDKTIILVWSALPEVFKNTDAHFNVGFALGVLKSFLQFWKSWVYICMNWEIFDINNVKKCEDWIFRKLED